MRRLQPCLVSTLVLMLMASAGLAQDVAQSQDVLSKIPANSIGFAAVNNLSDAGAKVDQFIADIGLREVIQGNVLEMIKAVTMIQQGVNEQGSLAVVMLDPAQFGWDVPKMISTPEEEEEPGPLPVAILIPGGNPMEIFANYQPEEQDGYVKVVIDAEESYAKAWGDYTVFAPETNIIDAIISSQQPVASKMSPAHQAMFRKLDAAVYVDMKMLAPIIVAGLDRMEGEMLPMMGAQGSIMGFYFTFYKDMVQQLDGVTFGLRIGQTGLLMEELASFQPDSQWGKIMASVKVGEQPKLDKLPALPYVLAMTAVNARPSDPQLRQESQALQRQLLEKLFASEMLSDVPQNAKDTLLAANETLDEQIQSMQFYGGGSAPDRGVFGLALMLKVNNADATRAAFADMADAVVQIVKAKVGEQAAEVPQFSMTYAKDAANVAGAPVDVIEFACPTVTPEDRAEMAKAFGEDTPRIYLAKPDEQTVVLTFGGAQTFLAEAVNAARGGSDLAKTTEVSAALAELPQNPAAIVLFNPANLLEVIKTGCRIMTGEEMQSYPWSTMTIQTQAPIAIGGAIDGSAVHYTVYIPTSLVGEGVRIFMEMQGGMAPSTTQKSVDEDF